MNASLGMVYTGVFYFSMMSVYCLWIWNAL